MACAKPLCVSPFTALHRQPAYRLALELPRYVTDRRCCQGAASGGSGGGANSGANGGGGGGGGGGGVAIMVVADDGAYTCTICAVPHRSGCARAVVV
ncbi:hypothetical protein M0804_013610 [Polistes exclamans]|nr:hypothetical protein M0804_013610 [Polistes exclamans]